MTEDPKNEQIKQTKRLMGALLRMPPKPHSDMKIGKPKTKKDESPDKNKAGKG
jgi:hypothetical protein